MLPLILENVSYTAGGRTLINDVSFEIGAGTRTVILGANGAGKTNANIFNVINSVCSFAIWFSSIELIHFFIVALLQVNNLAFA